MLSTRLFYLIVIASLARTIVAALLELSNDEVYYVLYALDLQANYFDHPPGVGVLIRLSTFNLMVTSELFVRLGAIVCAGLGTYFSFQLGTLLKNERTGWLAAVLYNTSIYTSVIAGTFIIPDSPQVVFWLASLWVMYKIILLNDQGDKVPLSHWLLFGVLTGLCILCKVHGIFLWFGFGLYILFFAPRLLKDYGLYVSAILAMVVISPILFWNIQNDFITYRFHSERVAVQQESIIHFDSFFQALGGQILYNNPINVVLVFVGLWKLRSQSFLDRKASRFILLNGLPIILVVSAMSLFNPMLPHWSGPGFMTLAFLAAAYLDSMMNDEVKLVPTVLRASATLVVVALVAAALLIRLYPGTIGNKDPERYGEDDFTLDMYGWRELAVDFKPWIEEQRLSRAISEDMNMVSHKWFPAAHLDYYIARPLKMDLIGVGDLTDLHQYFWLNKSRRDLQKGDSALCVIPSNYPVNMEETYMQHFASADLLHTFPVSRGGEIARYFKVYRLNDYQMNDQVHQYTLGTPR